MLEEVERFLSEQRYSVINIIKEIFFTKNIIMNMKGRKPFYSLGSKLVCALCLLTLSEVSCLSSMGQKKSISPVLSWRTVLFSFVVYTLSQAFFASLKPGKDRL